MIVAFEIRVENRLHLVDGLEPGEASFDAEVLVEQGAVQSLDDAVRLRAPLRRNVWAPVTCVIGHIRACELCHLRRVGHDGEEFR